MAKLSKFLTIGLSVGLSISASVVYAAEESGIDPHMTWRVINFVIFVGLLFYLLKKPVTNYFKSRRESIVEELEEAQRLKEEAEKLLEETQKKLKTLEDEIKNILETFESMAENERQQILKEVERAIERIRASIEEEKASLMSKAKLKLLTQMSKEAIENLRKRFEDLSDEEHAKINEKFIRSLQQ